MDVLILHEVLRHSIQINDHILTYLWSSSIAQVTESKGTGLTNNVLFMYVIKRSANLSRHNNYIRT